MREMEHRFACLLSDAEGHKEGEVAASNIGRWNTTSVSFGHDGLVV